MCQVIFFSCLPTCIFKRNTKCIQKNIAGLPRYPQQGWGQMMFRDPSSRVSHRSSGLCYGWMMLTVLQFRSLFLTISPWGSIKYSSIYLRRSDLLYNAAHGIFHHLKTRMSFYSLINLIMKRLKGYQFLTSFLSLNYTNVEVVRSINEFNFWGGLRQTIALSF